MYTSTSTLIGPLTYSSIYKIPNVAAAYAQLFFFYFLDHASTSFHLEITDPIHIERKQSTLNHQRPKACSSAYIGDFSRLCLCNFQFLTSEH